MIDEKYLEELLARVVDNRLEAFFKEREFNKKYLSSKEAADYLKCEKQKVIRMFHKKELPGSKVGGMLVFATADLDQLVEKGKNL